MLLVVMLAFAPLMFGCGGSDAAQTSAPSQVVTVADSNRQPASDDAAADAVADSSSDESIDDSSGEAIADSKPWGTLRGRFVYDGTPPVRKKVQVTKDVEVCTQHHPMEDHLVVDDNGGVANVSVWLLSEVADVHPDYAESIKNPVTLDNKHCRFEPYFAAVRVGQTLLLSNSDPIPHNVFCAALRSKANTTPKDYNFNNTLQPGQTIDKVFPGEEKLGVPMSCGSHGWMKTYILLKKTPYVAISQSDGAFEIANLPAGATLEFKTYHAPSGYIASPSIAGTATTWKKGQFTFEIAEGDNDMGDILLTPKDLE